MIILQYSLQIIGLKKYYNYQKKSDENVSKLIKSDGYEMAE